MRDYELVAIVSPERDAEGVSHVIERMTQSISGRGGEVEEVTQWGRRKLAYPIRKFMEADYILARFKLMPKFIKDLEADIGAAEDVLRYLVVKLDG